MATDVERDERIKEDKKKGMSNPALAKKYGLGVTRISQILNDYIYRAYKETPKPREYVCERCARKNLTFSANSARFCAECRIRIRQEYKDYQRDKEVNSMAYKLREFGVEPREGRELVRMQVRLRDDFTCQDCGKVVLPRDVLEHNKKLTSLKGKIKNLDIHHLDGLCGKNSRGYDKVEEIQNLITLCHACHYHRPDHSGKGNNRPIL